jgi:uncharacterized protein with HEPN domain
MRDLAESALEAVKGRSLEEFPAGALVTDGLIYRLILIGEAASHVPPEEREHFPTIPWRGTIGLRNRMIHGYDTIDLERVWRIIHDELPPLLDALRGIVGDEPPRT